MRAPTIATILGAALAVSACAQQGQRDPQTTAREPVAPLWGDLDGGAHAVGFELQRASDSSRPFVPRGTESTGVASIARPIQMSIWYPAVPGRGPAAIAFGDYAALVGIEGRDTEADSAARTNGREELVAYLTSLGAAESAARGLLKAPTAARLGATRSAGRFPVVVITPGKDGSPLEHVVLAEVLASHGFLVVAHPAMGAERRSMAWTVADIEAQVADIHFVLARIASHPAADVSRVGIVGYSFGAAPAIIASRRNRAVRGIVSLDGSIGFRDRVPIYRSMSLPIDADAAPVLHIHVRGEARNDLSLLESLAPGFSLASMAEADHLSFTSLAMFSRAEATMSLGPFHEIADPAQAHAIAVTLTSAFLTANLHGRRDTWAALIRDAPRIGQWPVSAGELRP